MLDLIWQEEKAVKAASGVRSSDVLRGVDEVRKDKLHCFVVAQWLPLKDIIAALSILQWSCAVSDENSGQ